MIPDERLGNRRPILENRTGIAARESNRSGQNFVMKQSPSEPAGNSASEGNICSSLRAIR